jgi:hypothetical protein
MTFEQKEAFNAVQRINDELMKKYSSKDKDIDYMPQLSVMFVNTMIFISLSIPSDMSVQLPEIPIYSSIHDDRIYYEKSDKYETFYKCIKRKFIEVKTAIYETKL